MSYELQAMSFELSDTSYEQRDMRYKIVPAPADDGTVHPWTIVHVHMIVQCFHAPDLADYQIFDDDTVLSSGGLGVIYIYIF